MHQLLENMIESLKCYKCQAIPGPNKDKRYSCHKNSHQLCETCRPKCKCNSSVMKTPNLIVEKLLQDLPVYCRNYRRNCRQIFDEVKDLEEHQKNCEFEILLCQNYRRKCPQKFYEIKDLEEHQKNCDFKILYCQNYRRKCPQKFYEIKDLEEHEKTCNFRILYCQNKIRKCNEKFSEVEELEKHQKTCDFRLIFCPSNECRKINNGEMLFTSWVKHKTRHKNEMKNGIGISYIKLKQPTKFQLRLSTYRENNGVLKYQTLFELFRLPNHVELYIIGEVVEGIPCPITGPKLFCTGQNFMSQHKNLTPFSASSKTFVLAQKTILLNANHLSVCYKMFVTATICKYFFWSGTKKLDQPKTFWDL